MGIYDFVLKNDGASTEMDRKCYGTDHFYAYASNAYLYEGDDASGSLQTGLIEAVAKGQAGSFWSHLRSNFLQSMTSAYPFSRYGSLDFVSEESGGYTSAREDEFSTIFSHLTYDESRKSYRSDPTAFPYAIEAVFAEKHLLSFTGQVAAKPTEAFHFNVSAIGTTHVSLPSEVRSQFIAHQVRFYTGVEGKLLRQVAVMDGHTVYAPNDSLSHDADSNEYAYAFMGYDQKAEFASVKKDFDTYPVWEKKSNAEIYTVDAQGLLSAKSDFQISDYHLPAALNGINVTSFDLDSFGKMISSSFAAGYYYNNIFKALTLNAGLKEIRSSLISPSHVAFTLEEGNSAFKKEGPLLYSADKSVLYAMHDEECPTSFSVPDSVKSIGPGAFGSCIRLQELTLPAGLTSLSPNAFVSCISLKSIVVPSKITSLPQGVFWNCSDLTSVTLSEGLTSIGTKAFMNCWDLETLIIPQSVTSIDAYAFDDAEKLHLYLKSETLPAFSSGWNHSHGIAGGADTSLPYYLYSASTPSSNPSGYWHYDSDGKTPVIYS